MTTKWNTKILEKINESSSKSYDKPSYNNPIRESFDWLDRTSYYDKKTRTKTYGNILDTKQNKKRISEIINMFLFPFSKIDSEFEKIIQSYLESSYKKLCHSSSFFEEVENTVKNGLLDRISGLLWNKGDPSLEKGQIISENFTQPRNQTPVGQGPKIDKDILMNFISNNKNTFDSFKLANTWITTKDEDWTEYVAMYFFEENQKFLKSHTDSSGALKYTTSDFIKFVNTIQLNLGKEDVIQYIKSFKPKPNETDKTPNTQPNKNEVPPTEKPTEPPSKCDTLLDANKSELQKNAKYIKNFVYEIMTVPMIFFIIYNTYQAFFFNGDNVYNKTNPNVMESMGCTPIRFSDWEKGFRKVENNWTRLFTEFLLKPVQIVAVILNSIQQSGTLQNINREYPYLVYLGLFAFIYFQWNSITESLLNIITGYSNGNIEKSKLFTFSTYVVWWYFGWECLKTWVLFFVPTPPFFNDRMHITVTDFASLMIPAFIKFFLKIFIWSFKAVITAASIPLSTFIVAVYIISYAFFGTYSFNSVFNSFFGAKNGNDTEKNTTHGIHFVEQIMYTKIYETFT